MNWIRVDASNIGQEHICCAIANNRDCQVAAKKEWLSARFADGLVFLKGDVRGKCFIEYLPAERAWAPVEAQGWLYIDCLWVAGRLQGQGYAGALLDACLADAERNGKQGLVTLSAARKKPFLADPKFLTHRGFTVCDTAEPDFRLMALPLPGATVTPRFGDALRHPPQEPGLLLYYSHQCPYPAKYVPLLAAVAERCGVSLRVVRLETAEQARSAPTPVPTFSLFDGGTFVTHEIPSEQKFAAFLAARAATNQT